MSFNENELRTHETNLGQAGCGPFTLPEMVTTQVNVVKGLYTELRNVQHVARGRVSRVFVLIDRESDGWQKQENPLEEDGGQSPWC